MITAENISITELERLVMYYHKAGRLRNTKLSSALQAIFNTVVSNSPLYRNRNTREANKHRLCTNRTPNSVAGPIVEQILNPHIPLICSLCKYCSFGIDGILNNQRRSTCLVPWNGSKALLRELAKPPDDPNIARPLGSTGFIYVNSENGNQINYPISIQLDPTRLSQTDYIKHAGYDFMQDYVKARIKGFRIGDVQIYQRPYTTAQSEGSTSLVLEELPSELFLTPNQYYSFATATCILSDFANNMFCGSDNHIVDLGSGSGWLGVLAAQISGCPTTTFIEQDPNFENQIITNCKHNGIHRPNIVLSRIQDTTPDIYDRATHAIINIGSHYKDGSQHAINLIIGQSHALRYVCFGGYLPEQIPTLMSAMSQHGFRPYTTATAPLIKSIAEMQLGKGYIESDVPYIGCTAISFTR